MLQLAELWQERLEEWKQELDSANSSGHSCRCCLIDILQQFCRAEYFVKTGSISELQRAGNIPQPRNQRKANENLG